MLLWLLISMLVIGILLVMFNKLEVTRFIVIFVSIIGLGVSALFLSVNYSAVDAQKAKLNERYMMLSWQWNNDIYADEVIGKRELMKDIQEWNEDIVWSKKAQRDTWIGVYIPDIYDDYEPISVR